MPPSATLSADDLMRLNLADKRAELVRGVLVVREAAGYRHGAATNRLAKLITDHVDAHDLGRVLAAETGFKLTSSPDTVRAPDIAFVRRERRPDPEPPGFLEIPPDLVVEVLSPGDGPGEVLAKVGDWLSAGTRLVWVVDPVRRRVRVYRADGRESVAAEDDVLGGEDVLPGFACRLELLW
jgi:Uma2 family endonuclease